MIEQSMQPRRRLLQLFAAAGVAAMGGIGLTSALEKQTLRFHVKGFYCPTCAVGMDTLLMQRRGITHARSTYPEGLVTVEFHPRLVTEAEIKQCVRDAGFVPA